MLRTVLINQWVTFQYIGGYGVHTLNGIDKEAT